MPTWPARLHLGSSTPNNPPLGSKSAAPKSQRYQEQPLGNTHQTSSLHGLPIPSTASLDTSRSSEKPRHERSHSHPFPSIFSGGRKAEKAVEADRDALEILDGSPMLSPGHASKDYMTPANVNTSQNGEQDFKTGKCITCDSLVRWPKHLDVFRCTVCLMVNDLKSGAGRAAEGQGAEASATSYSVLKQIPPKKGNPKRSSSRSTSDFDVQPRLYLWKGPEL